MKVKLYKATHRRTLEQEIVFRLENTTYRININPHSRSIFDNNNNVHYDYDNIYGLLIDKVNKGSYLHQIGKRVGLWS
jgi:hypothetical protein